eukprot:9372832-Lingulodinium_polyedra.AAC.1
MTLVVDVVIVVADVAVMLFVVGCLLSVVRCWLCVPGWPLLYIGCWLYTAKVGCLRAKDVAPAFTEVAPA